MPLDRFLPINYCSYEAILILIRPKWWWIENRFEGFLVFFQSRIVWIGVTDKGRSHLMDSPGSGLLSVSNFVCVPPSPERAKHQNRDRVITMKEKSDRLGLPWPLGQPRYWWCFALSGLGVEVESASQGAALGWYVNAFQAWVRFILITSMVSRQVKWLVGIFPMFSHRCRYRNRDRPCLRRKLWQKKQRLTFQKRHLLIIIWVMNNCLSFTGRDLLLFY
jgi:hypothetical protein